MLQSLILVAAFSFPVPAAAADIDCTEAYGLPARCQVIECSPKYQAFLGTWKGPFEEYVHELSTNETRVYRPYANTVTYDKNDCLLNPANGDRFIIGRKTDVYPAFRGLAAKTAPPALLITGKSIDGNPFLRTVEDGKKPVSYVLAYQNEIANVSAWSLDVPENTETGEAEMRFATIDGQDQMESRAHKRTVTVTMSMGPKDKPIWSGVIVRGYHVLQK